ncbi:MAG: LytTR family DNA-binding domain-containing protein [Gemmatimonadota bacterium]|nr:LytTR family DNA-binding domain-containing protein [Gemmatimonadota bacterium]
MSRLRVLVVDDEPLAREGLRDLLAAEPATEVVGEAGTGLEALAFLAAQPVDLVFLDISMPELDGLGVAAELLRPGGPMIVFVTAYSEHAVRAFELNAVDYLLKPFDLARLQASVARVRERRQAGGGAGLGERLEEMLAELRRRNGYAERVLVRDDGRIHFVALEEIEWMEAADNYVRLHAGDRQHLVRETMGRLEQRLDPARFARIHRSTIVNLSRIRHLEPTFNGEYVVVLRSGARLTLSRTYRDAVKGRLGGDW